MLAVLVAIGCADDDSTAEGGSGSTSAATTTSGSTASGSGSAGTSEGGSGGATSTGVGGATSTGDGTGNASLATTAAGDTSGTTGSTTGGSQGLCDECSPEELCMQFTQHDGPRGGGRPNVMIHCFPYPEACDEALDCRCAGHLCPEAERGAAASCETADGILHCSVAYP